MKASRSGSFVSLIIMAVLGVLMILFPGSLIDLAVKIFGVGLLIFGVGGIISDVMGKSFRASEVTDLVGKIAAVVIGFVCFFNTGFVVGLFHIILGGIIIWHSVTNLLGALDGKALGNSWVLPLVLSIVGILAGILILLGVFGVERLAIVVAGVVLVYNAVVGLLVELKK